jgi:hypothetical protein
MAPSTESSAKRFGKKWLEISRMAGTVLGHILLTIFYFTLMLPFSIGTTLFGDPLGLKQYGPSNWVSRKSFVDSLEAAKRQF